MVSHLFVLIVLVIMGDVEATVANPSVVATPFIQQYRPTAGDLQPLKPMTFMPSHHHDSFPIFSLNDLLEIEVC